MSAAILNRRGEVCPLRMFAVLCAFAVLVGSLEWPL